MNLSYDVRIWKIQQEGRAKNRPYRLRWIVAGRRHSEYFATLELAEGRKAGLTSAARRGEAFDVDTGLPVSEARAKLAEAAAISCFGHAVDYARYKWPRVAGNSRVSIAETLQAVTLALLPDRGRARPNEETLRRALRKWAFNGRQQGEPPTDVVRALTWVESVSPLVTVLEDLDTVRQVLDSFTRKLDGTHAAATYYARRRQVFHNMLKYAVTKKRLTSIALSDPTLNWERPSDMEVDHVVDPRTIGGTNDVLELLTAVSYVGRWQGPRFVAFFGCMYYAMMRPEEVCGLGREDCDLPDSGWGALLLEKTSPAPGKDWTDHGTVHDPRGLKHRPRKTVRPVPIPPELVRLLRDHIDQFGVGPGGRIFRSVNGNPIGPSTYSRVWKKARELGLPPDKVNSVLLGRPYDLRCAGISLRLYAGVPPRQVAEWAGHSVEVLQRIYSKILEGFDDTWFARIDEVLDSGPPKPRHRPHHSRVPRHRHRGRS